MLGYLEHCSSLQSKLPKCGKLTVPAKEHCCQGKAWMQSWQRRLRWAHKGPLTEMVADHTRSSLSWQMPILK